MPPTLCLSKRVSNSLPTVVRAPLGLQGPVEVVKKGTIRNIQLTMEDRQGGRKHVTRVTHVESFGFDADELAGLLQRKFQTSAAVTKLPGQTHIAWDTVLMHLY